MAERSEFPMTYGGEVEMLTSERSSGSLASFDSEMRTMAQDAVRHIIDIDEKPISVGYDSSRHLIEIGAGVHNKLASLVHALIEAISTLEVILSRERRACLLSLSYHPVADMDAAYENVLPKPMYDLWRGVYGGQHHLHPDVLPQVYPTNPEKGRGWQHKFTTLATSVQPWNSLPIEAASDQLAIIQATSWLFNLLTANSPFAGKKRTGKRDIRLEIWESMLGRSRYKGDSQLTSNLPMRPRGLTDYYRHVFGNQRIMAVPCVEVHTTGSTSDYKKQFRAVVQPADDQEFSVLNYLNAESVSVVDIYTGEVQKIKPSVAHVFNGYDFLYFPRYGARLRVNLPQADRIDPKAFAHAILVGDDDLLQELFIQGGIRDGFICIEGRVPATVLPIHSRPDWKRFSIPFVLQTAILRCSKEIFALLTSRGLTWPQLVEELPTKTNDCRYGFKTSIQDVHVTGLAQQIWEIAKGSLSYEERELVGDEIDCILSRQKAPAEEQLDFVKEVSASTDDCIEDNTFARLIDHFTAIVAHPLPV